MTRSTIYDWIFNDTKDRNKTILTTSTREYSFGDIERETEFFMNLLGEENIKGKKIGVLIPSIFHHLSLIFAINRLGGTVILLSWQFRTKDLTDVLAFLDPHMVLSISVHNKFDFMEVLEKWASSSGKHTVIYETCDFSQWNRTLFEGEERAIETKRMDLIACSSGSTGTPKGIVMNREHLWEWMQGCDESGDVQKTDRIMTTIPVTAIYGLSTILNGLRNQTRVVINETFDLPQMIETFYNQNCNKLISTPSIFRAFHTFFQTLKPQIAERLELCGLAGEMISEEFIHSVSGLDTTKFLGCYGLSEAGILMLNKDLKGDLNWIVRDQVEFKICPLDNDLTSGELMVRADSRFEEYYHRPDLTADMITSEGWMSTGDIVQQIGERTIKIIGRKKDMIKKGGQQVIPGEIESVLSQFPLVKQAVVMGVPHKILGERIVAFVIVEQDFDLKELYASCHKQIASFKVPDLIKVIEEFPVIQGKVDKMALRNLIAESEK